MPAGIITPTTVRTDWRCNSGTIVATLPATVQWTLDQTIENHLVMKRLTLTVPMDAANYDQITVGRVIQLDYRDASTSPATDDWEEYRITDHEEDLAARVATFEAVWWIQDLLEKDSLVSRTSGTVTTFEFTDYAVAPATTLGVRVIGALPTYWSNGTITPTAVGDVSYSRSTPLAGALAVAAMAKRVTGVTYEFSARRNGTSGLYLDLTVFGAGAVDVRAAKNLSGLRRVRRRAEQGTKVTFDADIALQRATYVVDAVSANTYIDVTEVNEAGPGPARENDQWNGAAWFETKNGTSHAITDTERIDFATTRLYMASTTTISAGDRGYLATDTGGVNVAYVNSPALQALYGVRLRVLPTDMEPYTNHVRNPDLRNGTSTTPTGWTLVTGTCAQRDVTNGLVRYGGISYYFTALGQLQWTETIYCVAGEVWTYSWNGFIGTFAANASVAFRDPQSGSSTTIILDGSDPDAAVVNTFVTLSRSYNITSTGNKTFTITVSLGGVGGAFYFDSAQLTRTPEAVSFRRGSGAADNIALANAFFDTNGAPLTTYDASLVDLSIDDPRTYAADRPLLGGTLYLTDADLDESRNGLRIVSLSLRSREQAKPRLQLSTLPRRLTSLLAA